MISIIIPAYNCQNTLAATVRSILSQTIHDYELIIVDDGSRDGTLEIAGAFSEKDPRIKVVHQENCGAYKARLHGIQAAHGDWIMFVDADDILPSNALALLMAEIDEDCDIVAGTLVFNGQRLFLHKISGIISPENYISAILKGETSVGPCAKLYRKSVVDKVNLEIDDHIRQNEDMLMLIKIASCARYVKIVPNIIVYDYISTEGSMSSRTVPLKEWTTLFGHLDTIISGLPYHAKLSPLLLAYKIDSLFGQGVLKNNDFSEIESYMDRLAEDAERVGVSPDRSRKLRIMRKPLLRKLEGLRFVTGVTVKSIVKKLIGYER